MLLDIFFDKDLVIIVPLNLPTQEYCVWSGHNQLDLYISHVHMSLALYVVFPWTQPSFIHLFNTVKILLKS